MQTIGDAGIASMPKIKMIYKKAHDMLGHKGIKETKLEAQYFNWELEDDETICEACSVGKAKKTVLPQVSPQEPLKQNKRRVYLDISTFKWSGNGERKFTQPH